MSAVGVVVVVVVVEVVAVGDTLGYCTSSKGRQSVVWLRAVYPVVQTLENGPLVKLVITRR